MARKYGAPTPTSPSGFAGLSTEEQFQVGQDLAANPYEEDVAWGTGGWDQDPPDRKAAMLRHEAADLRKYGQTGQANIRLRQARGLMPGRGGPGGTLTPPMPTEITDRPDGMIPEVAPRMPKPALATRAPGVGEGEDVPGVSGRLRGLLSRTSPYIQRARTRATQAANRRGLMSSSIAAGAGEAAAIDAALPIAQADAGIAAQLRDHRVQLLMQQRGLDHDAAQAQFQRDFAGRQAALDRGQQQLMQERGLSHDAALAEASRGLKQRIAVQTATQQFQDRYQTSIDRLALNPDLPLEERQRLEEHYAFLRDQAIDALRAIYGIPLDWAQSTRPPVEEAA